MIESNVDLQRQRFAGKYVAWRDGTVVVSADSFDELCDELESPGVDTSGLLIEFLEPTDTICVY
jgi:hypothetical protein